MPKSEAEKVIVEIIAALKVERAKPENTVYKNPRIIINKVFVLLCIVKRDNIA